MKCRDCEHWGWGDDEGTPVWGWCWIRTSCPDPDIERTCLAFSPKTPDIFTALSTLQTENEELSSDLRRLQTERDTLWAANQHLLAERDADWRRRTDMKRLTKRWCEQPYPNLAGKVVCEYKECDSIRSCEDCIHGQYKDRLAAIEDILGDEYDLDELSKAMAALRRDQE